MTDMLPEIAGTDDLNVAWERVTQDLLPDEKIARGWLTNGWGVSLAQSPRHYCGPDTVEMAVIQRTDNGGFEVLPPNPVADDVIGWADANEVERVLRALAELHPASHWRRTLTDSSGSEWVFAYTGGSVVRIRPEEAPDNHWTNTISLDSYGLKPDTITVEWLSNRTREWIEDRNEELASGLYN